ncbi:Helicase [Macleaya cordata]|uniref:RNA helicase n=1 Tax=Macleaya cordata TaxID=56857 RepID=A0A200PN02_MACCD|nr:Helicase [Macleaya cordata]
MRRVVVGPGIFRQEGPSTSSRGVESPLGFRPVGRIMNERSDFNSRFGKERQNRPANYQYERPNFIVELRLGIKGSSKKEIEGLIRECTAYDRCFILPSVSVPARLFFQQWSDALNAVVFFWSKRLDGAHFLNPLIIPNVFVPSDEVEMRDRLKDLFIGHVQKLLEGEVVQKWRKKMEAASDEISKIEALLKRRHVKLAPFNELQLQKGGLEAERDLIMKRLNEFRDSMNCILVHLQGFHLQEDCAEVEVLRFPSEFDKFNWSRIHCVLMRECRRLEESLPIYSSRRKILQEIQRQQVIVLIGETGSGKSTQLVQFLADSGLAADRSIICTQPRKIAAISLAQRVGEESNGCYEDNSIICYPSFSSAQRFNSKVIFMTDHCLLQHYMNDEKLARVSCIIIDEAHERSLNTDLLLALIKGLLLKRLDLKLIIMSATADADKLSVYFFGCETIHVVGRSFPVDIKYVPSASSEASSILRPSSVNCAPYVSDVVRIATNIHKTEREGAILAFLTSAVEVEWACENFEAPHAVPLALHGKLSSEEQNRVFRNYPGERKIIFATNLAETSLTIPGVKYVVDSGMVKECRFEPSNGMNVLKVCRISQSSANQRAGRAGRTEPGKCYRLYSEFDFQSMPAHQEPEIRRVHLGVAVLRILALGVKDVQEFDFVDAPSPKAIDRAIKNLIQLGAISKKNGVFEFTDTGRYLVKLGIEPQLGKLILDSFDYRLKREGLVLAAVMANASSIFCRVGNEEDKSKSDCLKVQFCHRNGDLFTLLSVYKEWEAVPHDKRNGWCWRNSINAKSMRRCKEVVLELEHCLKNELSVIVPSYWSWKPRDPTEHDNNLKKVILSSLAENVAMYSGYDRLGYQVALTGQHVQLHPSCSLLIYGQKPSWVVFGELLSMSNQYLVCVTAFDYECLSTLSPPPPFDISQMESRKLQVTVMTGFGNVLLRRFCGKASNSLLRLVSRLRTNCRDERISIDVSVDKGEVQIFASSEDMKKVYTAVNDALEYEKKWLSSECIEKCLCRGGPGVPPSMALFGAGAEIKHLELGKKYLTVEVLHSNACALDDKELLMMFEECACGISGFHKFAGIGQLGEDSEKWGRITFNTPEVLNVFPSHTTIGADHRTLPYSGIIKAKVFWPRRHSKGFAIVTCERGGAESVINDCFNLLIGRNYVRCELGKKSEDSVIIYRLDREVSEPEIFDVLKTATTRSILDVHVVRGGDPVTNLTCAACEEALLREIAPFMPSRIPLTDCCRVQVFPPEPKDYSMRATITFYGDLHLEAAKALDNIRGKVLPGCLSWQKIQCQQRFDSSLSCPAPVYYVIKKQLDSLLESFTRRNGVFYNLERYENGSCRVKISANATKTVVELRKPLEQLMKGKTINHASLTASTLQLLSSFDGVGLMRSIQRETGTYILHDKQRMTVRVFGPHDKVAVAEHRLVESLVTLHENKQLEIRLRGGHLPHNLLKEVVEKFGPDLHGLKEKVPGAEFALNTRRHVLSVQGNDELKKTVEEMIYDIARSINDNIPSERPEGEESTCPVCLCEVEDSYQLEACGHKFCRSCLVEQGESAIRSQDSFPICCAHTECTVQIVLTDLRSLFSVEKLDELFKASLGAFVASSGGIYRFCPSPDCPAVYRVADPGEENAEPFLCGACYVETCRKCHLEYHPHVTCEAYKAYKEDPDWSLKEWRKGKENVKSCPNCACTIEKVDGCNHISCSCGNHICWECLESFKCSEDCYGHLRSVHNSLI